MRIADLDTLIAEMLADVLRGLAGYLEAHQRMDELE